jgi:hypothetical protein
VIDIIKTLLGRTSIRGFEARHGLETFAAVACSALTLPPVRVHWESGCATAAINQRGDLILSDIPDDAQVARAQFARWVGYVVHELLHRRYTDFTQHDGRPYVDALHNALEDAWIESRAIKSGLLGNIRAVLGELVDGMTREALASVQDWANPSKYPYSLAVFTRPHASVKTPVPATLLPIWREAARRVTLAQNSADTLDIAQWVFSQLRLPEAQRDQQQDGQQGGKKDGKKDKQDDGQKAPGDAQEADQQDGQQDAQDGDQQAPGAPQDAPDAGPAQVPGDRTHTMDTEPTMEGGGGASFGPEGVRERPYMYDDPRWPQAAPVPGSLRFQMRRLLESSATDDLESHRLSGSLDTRRLAASAWTGRVFARRTEEAGIDAAVAVLVDLSGSMSGERAMVAVPAAMALLEVAESAQAQTLGAVFGDEVAVFKKWAEPVRRVHPLARRLSIAGGTNDAYSIRWVHDQLLRHPAPRKILIVLTDGVGDREQARDQIRAGERLGIRTIGIGIQFDIEGVYGPGSPNVMTLADLAKVAFRSVTR